MRAIVFLAAMTAPAYSGVVISDCELQPRHLGASYETVRCQAQNTSMTAVASFRYEWIATEEGREVPWSTSDRMRLRRIDGGIEPGEVISISFYPNRLNDRADRSLVEYRFHAAAVFDVNHEPIE